MPATPKRPLIREQYFYGLPCRQPQNDNRVTAYTIPSNAPSTPMCVAIEKPWRDFGTSDRQLVPPLCPFCDGALLDNVAADESG
jgi:hypothetical protein